MYNELGAKRNCKQCGRAGLWRFPPVVGRTFFCSDCGAVQAGLHTTAIGNTIKLHDLAGDPGVPVAGEIWRNGSKIYMYTGGSILDVTATSGDTIPSGLIAMWSGLLSAIPAGWTLCDGTAGTPNMRDRIVHGWSTGVNPGGTGGADSHTHDSGGLHQHNFEGPTTHTGSFTHSNAGSHQHAAYTGNSGSGGSHDHDVNLSSRPTGTTDVANFAVSTTTTDGDHFHSIGHQHASDGSHGSAHGTHSVDAHSTHRHDQIGSHDHGSRSNLPLYVKLAFLMKV